MGMSQFGQQPQNTVPGPSIAFPPDGAILQGSDLTLKVRDGLPPYVWLLNGAPIAQSYRTQVDLSDIGQGFAAITVIDATGQSEQAQIEIQPDAAR